MIQDALSRPRLFVISHPFSAHGHWQLIAGDACSFRLETFSSWAEANEQFESAGRLAAFGDPLYDFVLIEAEMAQAIRDNSSYQNALSRLTKASVQGLVC